MRKIKEVLRLRFELQLGQREIARACSISQGAVHNYLKKAAAAGIGWPPRKTGMKNASKKHFSVIAIPSNGGKARFRLSRTPRAVPATSSSDSAVGLGRVSASPSGRIRLQPLLRTVRAVAPEAGRSATPEPHAWGEGFRRLGWENDPHSGSPDGRDPRSGAVPDGAGREQLHLCRSHLGSADGLLASLPHSRL